MEEALQRLRDRRHVGDHRQHQVDDVDAGAPELLVANVPLLAFAREHGAPVRALEPIPRPPLGRRDPAVAARVAALAAAHADHLIVVVLGQAHLVGGGRQLDRCALPQLALGALPPASLPQPAPTPEAGSLLRSDGGLWWFAEVLTRAR
jgi:hypothetical protein